MRRARHLAAGNARFHFFEPRFEQRAAGEGLRLVRRPSAELRIPRAAREIGIRLGVRHPMNLAFDPDLAA
jgi:hypothetical protein